MKNEHLQEAHNILTHCLWPAAVAAGEVASIEAARNLIAQADADFAQASAEIRWQAFLEAADICDKFDDHAIAKMEQTGNPLQGMKANGCRKCGMAIRALAQSEQEKS